MIFLVNCGSEELTRSEIDVKKFGKINEYDNWYGAYDKTDKKIGFANRKLEIVNLSGKKYFRYSLLIDISEDRQGVKFPLKINLTAVFRENDLQLENFTTEFNRNGIITKARGSFKKDEKNKLVVVVDNLEREFEIKTRDVSYIVEEFLLTTDYLKKGKSIDITYFTPYYVFGIRHVIKYKEDVKTFYSGVKGKLKHFTIKSIKIAEHPDLDVYTYKNNIVEFTLPAESSKGVIRYVLEDKNQAQADVRGQFFSNDIKISIIDMKYKGNAKKVIYNLITKYAIELPNDKKQKIMSKVVENKALLSQTKYNDVKLKVYRYVCPNNLKKKLSTKHLELSKDDAAISKLVQDTDWIKSQNSFVKRNAKKLAGKTRKIYPMMEKLLRWIDRNFKKELRLEQPDVKELIDNPGGTSLHCASLFAGLTRSLGIPTKIVGGLAYNKALDRFVIHFWDEVYLYKYWFPVDPFFNQIDTDAYRIKLISDMELHGFFPDNLYRFYDRNSKVKILNVE